MPIEREIDKILALPDDGFFRWRAGAREALAQYSDAQLSRLYEVSGQEFVNRAARAWAAGRDQ
jgi:hypothetical protein